MDLALERWLDTNHGDRTLLGVCPMSEEIVTAAIRTATDHELLPMFIATPRQVDAERGYTGWSQQDLIAFIDSIRKSEGYTGPVLVARDHGGPYQSIRDRGDPEVDLDTAMEYAMETFRADLAAGFDVLHVDATEDPRVDGPLEIDEIVRRTVDLIDRIEAIRDREGYSPVRYEVGTEEIAGGLTDPAAFGQFLDQLEKQLATRREGVFDRVVFAVAQVGTTMRIDMENRFDAGKASTLVQVADERDVFVKVHFTDWLETTQLEQFPELGIGAANVGPEFAATMVESLIELERHERRLLDEIDGAGTPSEFTETLETAAVRDAPWKKYAPSDVDPETFASENRRNIALCVGRYVLGDPAVESARSRLYENLTRLSSIDPNEAVVGDVTDAIVRYARAFSGGE